MKEFKDKIKSKLLLDTLNEFPEYQIAGEYKSMTDDLLIHHTVCGNTYTVRPKTFASKNGSKCPHCSPFKLTIDHIIKRVSEHDPEYEVLSTEFHGTAKPITLRHIPTGYIYDTTWDKFYHNNDKRTTSKYKTEDEYIERFRTINDPSEWELIKYDNGDYLTDIVWKDANIQVLHKPCGRLTELGAYNAIRRDMSCASCSRLNDDRFNSEIDATDGEYVIMGEYTGKDNRILIKHTECGKEYEVFPHNFIAGNRCTDCAIHSRSRGEIEMFEYIRSIYDGPIVSNYRDENKLEIDIYLSELNIGIEHDGIYWHSDEVKGKNNIKNKMDYFNAKGIRMIHIFEDEWAFKKDIIKNKLKHILGLSTDKVYARKTKIYIPTKKEKSEFLNNTHIQGDVGSSIEISLKENDDIVALMTLGKRKIFDNDRDTYEIIRYSTSKNVVGGFMKILKYFMNEYGVNQVISYADLRFTDPDSNVYINNGFILENISRPNYFYVSSSGDHRLHRSGFMKHKIKERFPDIYDDSKTEYEMMRELKYNRIHDAGNAVYVYNKQ